jgi:hypothetical protein
MTGQNLNSEVLDTWQGERHLDRMRAPARHAIAAWALAAAFGLATLLGPPASRQVVAGLVELRHEVLMLDRVLERVSVRFQSADRGAFPTSPSLVAAVQPDQTVRA